jgi:membrane-associated protease RseP (regulator of RpoE activity)
MDPAQVNKVEVPIKLKEDRHVSPPSTVSAMVRLADEPQNTPIISINKHKPRDIIDAYVQLLKAKAETRIEFEFSKDPPLGVWAKATAPPDAIVQAKKKLGISIEPLTPMLAQKYGLDIENGMIVNEVQNGSVAARSGVEAGDIILGLGPYRIATLDDFGRLLAALPKTGRVQALIRRGNQQGYLSLQIGAKAKAAEIES